MDEETLLQTLTSLLHHHHTLLHTPNPPPPLLTLTDSSPSHLFFFTLSSLLSHLSSIPKPLPSQFPLSAFRALTTSPSRDLHWRNSYSLSYPLFSTILSKLQPYIESSNLSIPPDYALSMVLARLANGLSPRELGIRYSLEPYLISKICNMVTRLLATKMYPEFIKIPVSRRRVVENAMAFEEIVGLPNVVGAVAGVPVRLRCGAAGDEGLRHRGLGYPSLLLQVVSDHKKIFWDVCVKAPGGSDNATHLRDSLLYHRLTSGDVVWDRVVNVGGQPIRPYIVGGPDYPLLSFLLTPFTRPTTPAQREFDSALMKGRSVVEEAIGLLKGRWKILRDLNVGLNHAPQTIVACCVLHNLCQIAREPEPELWAETGGVGDVARVLETEQTSHFYGESLRQALADDLYQRISR